MSSSTTDTDPSLPSVIPSTPTATVTAPSSEVHFVTFTQTMQVKNLGNGEVEIVEVNAAPASVPAPTTQPKPADSDANDGIEPMPNQLSSREAGLTTSDGKPFIGSKPMSTPFPIRGIRIETVYNPNFDTLQARVTQGLKPMTNVRSTPGGHLKINFDRKDFSGTYEVVRNGDECRFKHNIELALTGQKFQREDKAGRLSSGSN